jgi:hypothetical protein
MADKPTLAELGELLASLCEFLREREKTFFDLFVDLEDLKAGKSVPVRRSVHRDARAHVARIQQLDAIIARIRAQ